MAKFSDFVYVITYLWRLQIGCKPSKLSRNFPGFPETFQTVQAFSRLSRKFFRLSGKFLDCLETFQTLQKLSKVFRNSPDCPKNFQAVWKLSTPSGNFSHCPIYFQTVWKPSRLMLCFELILSQFCRYAQKLSRRAKFFQSAR